MRSTEQEILEGSDVVGAGTLRHMGRSAATRWVTRKVAPQKMAQQGWPGIQDGGEF